MRIIDITIYFVFASSEGLKFRKRIIDISLLAKMNFRTLPSLAGFATTLPFCLDTFNERLTKTPPFHCPPSRSSGIQYLAGA